MPAGKLSAPLTIPFLPMLDGMYVVDPIKP